MSGEASSIELPRARLHGEMSVEEAMERRRSVRAFSQRALTLAQAGQLLWAAQGESGPRGLRTAPSAGALYPLETYLVAGAVSGLEPGVYRYRVDDHHLLPVAPGDRRGSLARAALGQASVSGAAAVIAIGAVYARTTVKYGERGRRYVHMEAGHAAQNLLLQATALGLAAVPVGAFSDRRVRAALDLAAEVEPLYLLPVGHSRDDG